MKSTCACGRGIPNGAKACGFCWAKKAGRAAAVALALVLLVAVAVSAQEKVDCASIGWRALRVTSEGSQLSPLLSDGMATEAQNDVATAALECAVDGNIEEVRFAGVNICDVRDWYLIASANDEKAPKRKFTDLERLVVRANKVILQNACAAETERAALLAKVASLETTVGAQASLLQQKDGEIRGLHVLAQATAAQAPVQAQAPAASDDDSEVAAEIRAQRNDEAYYRMMDRIERDRREDRYEAQRQREREEYERERRREAQELIEATRELRKQQEDEEWRRRGTPPPSRLEGYAGLDK